MSVLLNSSRIDEDGEEQQEKRHRGKAATACESENIHLKWDKLVKALLRFDSSQQHTTTLRAVLHTDVDDRSHILPLIIPQHSIKFGDGPQSRISLSCMREGFRAPIGGC